MIGRVWTVMCDYTYEACRATLLMIAILTGFSILAFIFISIGTLGGMHSGMLVFFFMGVAFLIPSMFLFSYLFLLIQNITKMPYVSAFIAGFGGFLLKTLYRYSSNDFTDTFWQSLDFNMKAALYFGGFAVISVFIVKHVFKMRVPSVKSPRIVTAHVA